MNPRQCFCGKEAKYIIQNELPNAIVFTYTCEEHREMTFQAIKWKLVSEGLWIPNKLTWRKIETLF